MRTASPLVGVRVVGIVRHALNFVSIRLVHASVSIVSICYEPVTAIGANRRQAALGRRESRRQLRGGMAPTTAQTAGSFPDASDATAINAKTPMPDPTAILSR